VPALRKTNQSRRDARKHLVACKGGSGAGKRETWWMAEGQEAWKTEARGPAAERWNSAKWRLEASKFAREVARHFR
jgi:hypothetical protein